MLSERRRESMLLSSRWAPCVALFVSFFVALVPPFACTLTLQMDVPWLWEHPASPAPAPLSPFPQLGACAPYLIAYIAICNFQPISLFFHLQATDSASVCKSAKSGTKNFRLVRVGRSSPDLSMGHPSLSSFTYGYKTHKPLVSKLQFVKGCYSHYCLHTRRSPWMQPVQNRLDHQGEDIRNDKKWKIQAFPRALSIPGPPAGFFMDLVCWLFEEQQRTNQFAWIFQALRSSHDGWIIQMRRGTLASATLARFIFLKFHAKCKDWVFHCLPEQSSPWCPGDRVGFVDQMREQFICVNYESLWAGQWFHSCPRKMMKS